MSDFHNPGGGAFMASAKFISPFGSPTKTSISPASGPAGTVVTVVGANFAPDCVVKLDSTTMTKSWIQKENLQFVAAGDADTYDVVIVSNGNTLTVTDGFEITA